MANSPQGWGLGGSVTGSGGPRMVWVWGPGVFSLCKAISLSPVTFLCAWHSPHGTSPAQPFPPLSPHNTGGNRQNARVPWTRTSEVKGA